MDPRIYVSIGDHIQRHYKDKWELSVDDLVRSLQEEKFVIQRHEVVSVFQTFQKNGLGAFIVGRRGRASRMGWKALPKDLSFEIAATSASSLAKNVEMLEYPLVVRPGVTARILLPADLSVAESARLAEFVQQLPLDGSGHAAAG